MKPSASNELKAHEDTEEVMLLPTALAGWDLEEEHLEERLEKVRERSGRLLEAQALEADVDMDATPQPSAFSTKPSEDRLNEVRERSRRLLTEALEANEG